MTRRGERAVDAERSGDKDEQGWGRSEPLQPHEVINLETLTLVEACWNAHDVNGILAHYQDDIAWHDVASNRTYRGKSEVSLFLSELFGAIPDLGLTITRRIPRGDLVAEEYTITGTHLGVLFGVPPTGRSLRLSAVSFVELHDGRFAQDQFYFDVATLLAQMGLFPPLAVAEHPAGHLALRALVFLRSPHRAFGVRRARASTAYRSMSRGG